MDYGNLEAIHRRFNVIMEDILHQSINVEKIIDLTEVDINIIKDNVTNLIIFDDMISSMRRNVDEEEFYDFSKNLSFIADSIHSYNVLTNISEKIQILFKINKLKDECNKSLEEFMNRCKIGNKL